MAEVSCGDFGTLFIIVYLCVHLFPRFLLSYLRPGDTDTDLEFLQRSPNGPDRATSLLFTNLALPPSVSMNTSQPYSAISLVYEQTPTYHPVFSSKVRLHTASQRYQTTVNTKQRVTGAKWENLPAWITHLRHRAVAPFRYLQFRMILNELRVLWGLGPLILMGLEGLG